MNPEKSIESHNESFYDSVYKSQNGLFSYLKLLISYDQQSKSRTNFLFIQKHFPGNLKNLKILDYGAGRGSMIVKFHKSNKLYGCDISKEAILNLKKTGELLSKPIVSFRPEEMGFKIADGSLDLVTSSHVLEHVPNDEEVLRMIWHKLKPEGHLFLNLPVNEVWNDPNHIRSYTEISIRNLIDRMQFSIIETKNSGRINGWLLHKKIQGGAFAKFMLLVVKSILILLPSRINASFENVLFRKSKHTHYLILAKKKA